MIRTNLTNGAINNVTFSLTTTIPIFEGDVLSFLIPTGVEVNMNGTTNCSSNDSTI